MPEVRNVWVELLELLGRDLLALLLGISKSKLRRYCAEPRSIPLGVFSRLNFLMEITDILKGGYNQDGVRQWFRRKRAQLGGRSPLEILKNNWSVEDPGPRLVLEIAKGMNV